MSYTTGWVLSNNEKGDVVIQKDDESDRFNDDDEATKFVVKSYYNLLEVCREILDHIESNLIDISTSGYIKENLQQVISEAEK